MKTQNANAGTAATGNVKEVITFQPAGSRVAVTPTQRPALVQVQQAVTVKQLDFGKDGALVKLVALFIAKLPAILWSVSSLVTGLAASGWLGRR